MFLIILFIIDLSNVTNPFRLAKLTVNKELNAGRLFTYNSICKKIIENGGILRISPGYTVGEYLEDLEDKGLLKNYFPKGRVMVFKGTKYAS